METPKRIHLLGSGRHEEAVAAEAITPGQLISLNSDGEVAKNSVAAKSCERLFALEDALQGKTIADDYADGDVVGMVVASPGDVVYGWLAAGENAAIGSRLVSNGDGTLQVDAGTEFVVGIALEAKDLTDSAAVDTRIRLRVV